MPVQQLRQDHANFSRVLDMLQREVGGYGQSLRDSDIDLIMQSIDYIRGYPQLFHHPLEDAAIDYLQAREVGVWEELERIRRQHTQLERETLRLSWLFQLVYSDHVVPMERIKECLQRYLDLQSKHMAREEAALFPLFENHIDDAGWRKILLGISRVSDPLFGHAEWDAQTNLRDNLGLPQVRRVD